MFFVFGSLHKNRKNIKSRICLFLLFAGECFQIFVILSSPFWETSPSLNLVNRAAMTAAFILATSATAYWVFVCFSVLSLPFLSSCFSVLCCAATFCTCVFEARRVSLGKPGRGPGGLLGLTQVQIILEATAQISTMGGAEGIRESHWENKPRVL